MFLIDGERVFYYCLGVTDSVAGSDNSFLRGRRIYILLSEASYSCKIYLESELVNTLGVTDVDALGD